MTIQIKNLTEMNEDDLYGQLGLKKRYAELELFNDGTAADASSNAVENFKFDTAAAGIVSDSLEKLKTVGREFFKQLSKSAYGICCGTADGSAELKKLIGKGTDAIIAAIAALLIAKLAMAAAIAAIVAALIVKLFFDAGGKVLCGQWKNSLPAEG